MMSVKADQPPAVEEGATKYHRAVCASMSQGMIAVSNLEVQAVSKPCADAPVAQCLGDESEKVEARDALIPLTTKGKAIITKESVLKRPARTSEPARRKRIWKDHSKEWRVIEMVQCRLNA